MIGKSTQDLRAELGPEYERVVVHTDDAVLHKDFGTTQARIAD